MKQRNEGVVTQQRGIAVHQELHFWWITFMVVLTRKWYFLTQRRLRKSWSKELSHKDDEKGLSHKEAPKEESIEGEEDEDETSDKQKSPWQIGISHASPEHEKISQLEDTIVEEAFKI